MIERKLYQRLNHLIQHFPAVALLGPRQVGKTTLAMQMAQTQVSLYLDLESTADRIKLEDPELYLPQHEDKLVILDEIQRMPELFQILRGLIDAGRRRGKRTGRFLILGSASLDLLQQSSESLAGRIAYTELSGFMATEVDNHHPVQDKLWLRGGFPESFMATNDMISLEWRQDFITTYLERDIPQLGPRIPRETLRRFWTMLAHNQGSMINAAKLAAGLGVSGQTVGRYLDLLTDLLLVRRLSPWSSNIGKRMVKSPKVYVRDSGIVHALLGINTQEALLGHPVVGMSWEGWVVETLLASTSRHVSAYFYRSTGGAEIDLILQFPDNKRWAIEIKRSLAPKPSKGFYHACEEIKPEQQYVVYPGIEQFPLSKDVSAISPVDLAQRLHNEGINEAS